MGVKEARVARTKTGKRFYCLDLGGLSGSRGPTKGGEVYTRVDDLPDDRGDLAIVWVEPRSGVRAVRAAHAAGCTRIWFSFHSAHAGSVLLAQGLGMEIVELGRCPVHYLPRQTTVCRLHTSLTLLTGAYQRPPQLDPKARRRELI